MSDGVAGLSGDTRVAVPHGHAFKFDPTRWLPGSVTGERRARGGKVRVAGKQGKSLNG